MAAPTGNRTDTGSPPPLGSPPETLETARGEIRTLTGLRLFAAAWVVIFHFQFTPGGLFASVLGPVDPLVETGALGVDLFYVLSGFVIAFTYLGRVGPALRPRVAWTFLWARVCRVWPVYAVVTNLFGLFLFAKLTWGADGVIAYQSVQPEMTFGAWLEQMFMVQLWTHPWHDGVSWVGPAWSISAEWLAYVLFPLTALAFFRLGRWRGRAARWVLAALAVALMAPIAVLCLRTGSPYFPYSWAARIGAGFASGVLVFLVVRRIPLNPRVRRVAAWVVGLTGLAILGGLMLGGILGAGPDGAERGGIVLILFPVLVGALALAGGGPARILATDWAVHGGRISYSLYLVHVVIFEVVWTAMRRYPALGPDTPGGVALGLAGLVGTFVAAHLLWRWVEEPSRIALRRLSDRRAAV
ncbi:MAG: acyltransferase family protein [Pseudonocardia sp.]